MEDKACLNLSCAEYSARLASDAPVPGGGGAGALAGALGAALGHMAAELSGGKKNVDPQVMSGLLTVLENRRREFLDLAAADAEAFAALAPLYALPKDAPDRAPRLEAALAQAARPPLNVMEAARDTLSALCPAAGQCTVLSVSDVGCAAALCRAALECGYMNVLANTRLIKNETAARELNAKAASLAREGGERADEIMRIIEGRLQS